MKRSITFEKSDLNLYIQANNSIYSLLGHDKHENNDIPLNLNLLSFTDKTLNNKLMTSLFLNQETKKVSSEFKYNLILFNIFHISCLLTLLASISFMYSSGNMTEKYFILQIMILLIIFTFTIVFCYSLSKINKAMVHSQKVFACISVCMIFFLIFTDYRVFNGTFNATGNGNFLIIGFYIVLMRHAIMENFKYILLTISLSIILCLIFIFIFTSHSLNSCLKDFFILTGFLITQAFDSYQADLRVKHLFWRKEKEKSMDDSINEENCEHSYNSLNTEIELIIQSCEKIKKTIKTASDVIMYKDVKTKLKIAQVELERVKRRIANGSMMEVVKLEQHPNISENDKLFIYENFTDFSRNTNKRKSRLHDSRVSSAPRWARELVEFDGLLGSFGAVWNFDIWFVHQTTGSSIYVTAKYLIHKWLLCGQLDLAQSTIDNYFLTLEHSYKNNPYHNACHGADVLHNIMYFYTNSEIISYLNPLELLSSIIAGLGHDVAHPALNNKFLVNSRDDIAMLYNDRSVLENMHASKTFEIMKKEDCDILRNFSFDDWISVRKIVVSMILETDMARHFEVIGKFRSRVSTLGDIDLQKSEDKEFIMNMAIKCADIGHAAKCTELHEKWTAFVCEEFFHQGDLEKDKGLPVSMYCDRNNTDIPKSQAGFIKNICLPLYESWCNYLRSDNVYKNCLEQIRINLKNWEDKDKKIVN